ncbi:MAG: uridine kinase [Ruminococcus sp.]|nr:uridine kinase [Ruminococcus sp.]
MERYITQIIREMTLLSRRKAPLPAVAAIDGRCASGKTTLAGDIARLTDCNVFHTDDFFTPLCRRTAERLDEAGGGFDRERFSEEILLPLLSGKDFSYRPYSCTEQAFLAPVNVCAKSINIIEGAYSCHKELAENYDLMIFLTCSPEKQLARITERNGADGAEAFRTRWIPAEEKYFAAMNVRQRCHMIIET